jgi:hypothetical protein
MNIGAVAQGARANMRRIIITLDGNKKPQVAQADEDVTISPANNEQIIWESAVDFLINFTEDSPFYERQFSNNFALSGLVRRNVIPSKSVFYEYTIIINGQSLDPRIRVDP